MKPRVSSFWKVFAIPLLIAVLTAAGLFTALLGDGLWDTLSWLGLGVPTLIGIQALLRRR
ncbi:MULTISPECIES: hypothetical protein [Pseudomonas]|uniref:DUF4175 domain-containing protein n=1 Tax=Pseudomonas asplenii TaxID=53407 RepID=A0A0N0E193_9PSED|nr:MULTISPECIES: hypothetical protein [Pseudomonas]KPA87412.1 hypothetical protein PF66_06042 [Pseudomonas fuscovaginae]